MGSKMNERIKLLAEQAGLRFTQLMSNPMVPVVDGRETDLEKFAQLVVKELCDMMQQTEDDVYALEPSERPTEYIQFLYDWRTRFEQHFGVE
jgi:hypothetical protein